MAPSIASISIKLGLQDCMAIYVRQSSIMAHFLPEHCECETSWLWSFDFKNALSVSYTCHRERPNLNFRLCDLPFRSFKPGQDGRTDSNAARLVTVSRNKPWISRASRKSRSIVTGVGSESFWTKTDETFKTKDDRTKLHVAWKCRTGKWRTKKRTKDVSTGLENAGPN